MAADLAAVSINLWLAKEGSPRDAIYDGHPLLRRLRGSGEKGRSAAKKKRLWREADGGEFIQDSPRIAQSNASTKIRGMEPVDATAHQPTKKAYWEWAMYGKIVSIPYYDAWRNMGKTAIISDWQDRTSEAIDRMKYDIEDDFCAANATGKEGWIGINGLDSLVNETATSPTTLGGLTRASYAGWQNYASDASDTFATDYQLVTTMFSNIRTVTGRSVDLMLTTAAVWAAMHSFLQGKGEVSFQKDGTPDGGFPTFQWLGAEVACSQHVKAESLYLLATEAMWMQVHRKGNFALMPEMEGTQYFGKTRKLVFMGNWAAHRFNSLGVVYDITG